MSDDLLFRSAADLVAEMAEGKLSAVELMQATLDRIDRVNPSVNAIVALRDREQLLKEAEEKDRIPVEQRGLLHGIPLAAKDFVDVAGLPTRKGTLLTPDTPVAEDNLLAQRMRSAGVIFIGKTNVPEFGFGSNTFNSVYGTTCNPYDQSRTCGGSSGGAGVALATGMLSIADGSDMMGSLRNPAAWNNVYGMRPSIGRVPPALDGDLTTFPIVTDGPMARNPKDLARLLHVQAGPDDRVPGMLPSENFSDLSGVSLKGKRIAWVKDWGGALSFEPGILDLCEQALLRFEELGAIVEEIAPPFSRDEMWESWTGIRAFLSARKLGDFAANPAQRSLMKDNALWEIEQGKRISGEEFHRLSVSRSAWIIKAAELFQSYDAMISPTTQVWPFPKDINNPTKINGVEMDTYHRWMEVVVPVSHAGLPSLNVPIGFGENGLPMGMQITYKYGADRDVLAIGQTWHGATDWPNARPPKVYQ